MTGAFRTYRPVTADDLEPLEARIEQGPLALKEALDIGRQSVLTLKA